ncbi:DUF2384 domain-containing protein [Rhodanobacter sp. DHB23]|uniref:DUF2384 domain-containing protein n=1 Tax=Rhodanobacter sp. DHB23 TaxID=2775923 RepID=UPI001786ABA4|nr:DUF2384 domain-containing protein [Rhodanobacter sp. DHB23]MBD8873654.1 DUF2384 domain-containing protein [Rhodanobacter sp. DHB23]
MSPIQRFRNITIELFQLKSARETVIVEAFTALEEQIPALASLAVQNIGERIRAAHWMSMHQRAFGDRSAYDLLADGDVDTVWDRLTGEDGAPLPKLTRAPSAGGPAY